MLLSRIIMLYPTFLAFISLFFALVTGKSWISTFSDSNCKDSITSLDGPNGYPNGTCTDLRKNTYGSFQVVGLDEGCAVTIYMNDTTPDICSGYAIVAEIATCYNSTWVYYSIDECTPSGTSNTVTPTFIPASTASSLTIASNSASTTSATAATVSPSGNSNTTAIVGGVVGGILGLALVVGVTVLLTIRALRRNTEKPTTKHVINEVHGESARPIQEIYEKATDVPAMPPVELPVEEHAIAGADPRKIPPSW